MAKVKIDFMTPAIFSIQLIEQLKSLKNEGILIRILSDRTFEESAQNLLYDSSKNFNLKVLSSKFIIPHNIVIIDQKVVVIGGAYYPSIENKIDHTYLINDKNTIKKYYESFQNLWQKISSHDNKNRLLRFQHFIDLNSIENNTNEPNETEENFVASKNGKKYYRIKSKAANRILKKNRIYFQDEEQAKNSGRERARNF